MRHKKCGCRHVGVFHLYLRYGVSLNPKSVVGLGAQGHSEIDYPFGVEVESVA
jgi:hypothetical protein